MAPVISVEQLGKRYLLGHKAETYHTSLRDVIASGSQRLLLKLRHPFEPSRPTESTEDFWALRDVSFEIQQGERIGIIGRNGAGKSTLLKILSRITEPTTGRAKIRGRVASLLEVGTGFHPELSGRENIFLNGAILGMSKAEIRRKFDEIVAFAEVERFLDTPVKRYSSGMYVRLAFAVAAHLEPEVLIIDEVLAVGDTQFQQKCLGKMQEVGNQGRTVLFVSHNMAAVTRLCESAIYLREGRLHKSGEVADVVRTYLRDSAKAAERQLSERKDRQGSGWARISAVDIMDAEHNRTDRIMSGQHVVIRIRLASVAKGVVLKNANIAIGIDDSAGQRVWHLSNESTGQSIDELDAEKTALYFQIPKLPLVPGTYIMTLFLSSNGTIVDWIQNAASFTVEPGDFYGSGRLPPAGQGCFLADYSVGVADNHV